MSVLLDTNILTRYCQPGHPHHPFAIDAVARLKSRGETLCIVTQNLYEFWSVATRPAAENGLGLTAQEASDASSDLRALFSLLPDHPALFPIGDQLVLQYDVRGKSAHDARLVAAMNANGVSSILTFDVRDFYRYPMIKVIDPLQRVQPEAPSQEGV